MIPIGQPKAKKPKPYSGYMPSGLVQHEPEVEEYTPLWVSALQVPEKLLGGQMIKGMALGAAEDGFAGVGEYALRNNPISQVVDLLPGVDITKQVYFSDIRSAMGENDTEEGALNVVSNLVGDILLDPSSFFTPFAKLGQAATGVGKMKTLVESAKEAAKASVATKSAFSASLASGSVDNLATTSLRNVEDFQSLPNLVEQNRRFLFTFKFPLMEKQAVVGQWKSTESRLGLAIEAIGDAWYTNPALKVLSSRLSKVPTAIPGSGQREFLRFVVKQAGVAAQSDMAPIRQLFSRFVSKNSGMLDDKEKQRMLVFIAERGRRSIDRNGALDRAFTSMGRRFGQSMSRHERLMRTDAKYGSLSAAAAGGDADAAKELYTAYPNVFMREEVRELHGLKARNGVDEVYEAPGVSSSRDVSETADIMGAATDGAVARAGIEGRVGTDYVAESEARTIDWMAAKADSLGAEETLRIADAGEEYADIMEHLGRADKMRGIINNMIENYVPRGMSKATYKLLNDSFVAVARQRGGETGANFVESFMRARGGFESMDTETANNLVWQFGTKHTSWRSLRDLVGDSEGPSAVQKLWAVFGDDIAKRMKSNAGAAKVSKPELSVMLEFFDTNPFTAGLRRIEAAAKVRRRLFTNAMLLADDSPFVSSVTKLADVTETMQVIDGIPSVAIIRPAGGEKTGLSDYGTLVSQLPSEVLSHGIQTGLRAERKVTASAIEAQLSATISANKGDVSAVVSGLRGAQKLNISSDLTLLKSDIPEVQRLKHQLAKLRDGAEEHEMLVYIGRKKKLSPASADAAVSAPGKFDDLFGYLRSSRYSGKSDDEIRLLLNEKHDGVYTRLKASRKYWDDKERSLGKTRTSVLESVVTDEQVYRAAFPQMGKMKDLGATVAEITKTANGPETLVYEAGRLVNVKSEAQAHLSLLRSTRKRLEDAAYRGIPENLHADYVRAVTYIPELSGLRNATDIQEYMRSPVHITMLDGSVVSGRQVGNNADWVSVSVGGGKPIKIERKYIKKSLSGREIRANIDKRVSDATGRSAGLSGIDVYDEASEAWVKSFVSDEAKANVQKFSVSTRARVKEVEEMGHGVFYEYREVKRERDMLLRKRARLIADIVESRKSIGAAAAEVRENGRKFVRGEREAANQSKSLLKIDTNAEITPDQFRRYLDKAKVEGSEGVSALHELARSDPESYAAISKSYGKTDVAWIPGNIYDKIWGPTGTLATLNEIDKLGNVSFFKHFDEMQLWWKMWTTLPFPQSRIRDALTNHIVQAINGTPFSAKAMNASTKIMGMSMRALHDDAGDAALKGFMIERKGGEAMSAYDILATMRRHNAIQSTYVRDLVAMSGTESMKMAYGNNKTVKGLLSGILPPVPGLNGIVGKASDNPVIRIAGKVAKYGDDQAKINAVLSRFMGGEPLESAIDEVMKVAYDGSAELSTFERHSIRRLVPFYAWQKYAVSNALDAYFAKPGTIAWLGKLHEYANKGSGVTPEEFERLVPEFIKDNLGVAYGVDEDTGQPTYALLNGYIPQAEIIRAVNAIDDTFSSDNSGNAFTYWMERFDPITKKAVETLANYSFYQQGPIESYEGERTSLLGISVTKRTKDLWRGIRFVNELDRLGIDMTDWESLSNGVTERESAHGPSEWYESSFTVGVRSYDVDIEQNLKMDINRSKRRQAELVTSRNRLLRNKNSDPDIKQENLDTIGSLIEAQETERRSLLRIGARRGIGGLKQ